MEPLVALLVGVLFGASVFMMLSRNLVRVAFGLILLSNAVNLAILAAGRLTRGAAPVIPAGRHSMPGPYANPLPQALILTAVVIGFAMLAFGVLLVLRAHQELESVDADKLRRTDALPSRAEEPEGPA